MSRRGFNPDSPAVRRFAAACRDAADTVEVTIPQGCSWIDYEISTASGVSLITTRHAGGDRIRVPRSRVAELVADGLVERP